MKIVTDISKNIEAVISRAADELVSIGMDNKTAAYRAMFFTGGHYLIEHLSKDELLDHLKRWRAWIDHHEGKKAN